ncbi:MAG: recombinase family protein [Eubacterium sp.]|nr:recombinase family protein [Eubacterium sp.]
MSIRNAGTQQLCNPVRPTGLFLCPKRYTLTNGQKTAEKAFVKVPFSIYKRVRKWLDLSEHLGGDILESRTYFYARVSNTDQNLDRQMKAFKSMGADDRNIITDKASGKDFERSGYQALKTTILSPKVRAMPESSRYFSL